jgi:hypothetical protein
MPSAEMVLGDVACVFSTEKHSSYTSYAGKEEGIKGIFLPISSIRVVVGTTSEGAPAVDGDVLNLGMVRVSRDYFVASRADDHTQELLDQLGTDARLLSEDDVKDIVRGD